MQRMCLTPTVLPEVDQYYQAGISAPMMNAQKKLFRWDTGNEGHQDIPNLNIKPALPWFPPVLALQISVETLPLNEGEMVQFP